MEDRYSAMDGSMQEYSSEESSGKVSWILNKGLTMGKKILVTGVVISSVPVVLPPLMVISVLGFACSVPYGLLLASYACTEKLMSKLLPGSNSRPFLLDYGKVLPYTDDDVEYDESGEGEDVGLKGDIDEDGHGGVRKDAQELVKDANVTVEESGYEEDVGEFEEKKEEEPTELEVEVRIEGVTEEEEKELVIEESSVQLPVDEVVAVVVDIEEDERNGRTVADVEAPFEVTDIVVELCKNTETKEDEKLVKKIRGLLEKMREEGMTDNGEKDKQSVETLPGEAGEGHQQVHRNVEDIGVPLEERVGNKHLGELEKNNDEIQKESSKVRATGDVQNADVIPRERDSGTIGGLSGKRDIDKPIGEMTGATDVGGIREGEQKPEVNKPSMLQGAGVSDSITNDVEQDIQLKAGEENVIFSTADIREIADESGFELFDNKDTATHSYADYKPVGENEHSSTYTTVTVDFTALPVFSAEHKCNGAGISSQENSGMASSKALFSEEKMWEQIDAVRRIVGYKAAPQATRIEELKALYLFTGVEPPALFKDPSDLVEVNDKLIFLMSIVGVK